MLPIVRSIQHQWPEAKITWIIGKLEAELVKDIEGVEFVIFDKSQGLKAYQQIRQQLKNRQFDVLLHMQISLRASLVSRFIKAPIKLGFDKKRAKNFQWLFTNYKIQPRIHRQHVLDGFFEFTSELGIKEKIKNWDIPIPVSANEFVKKYIGDQKYVAINPCTSARANNYRNLPVETYAQIINYIQARSLQVILTGGPAPEEKSYSESISELCEQPVINLVGKTNLKELLAVLNNAEFVIAPDTGPLHMANACGKKVIGLYASSNPERTGPYSNLENTVNKYPEAVQKEFNDAVENIKWGKRVRDPDVMSLITADDVIEKIDKIL